MLSVVGAVGWIGLLAPSAGGDTEGRSVAVDSSGNMYVIGHTNPSGNYEFQLAKYSSSGIIQWQRNLGDTSSVELGYSVALDSSGNVYVCGTSNVSGTYNIQIAKYNTSGVIQWQRSLNSSSNLEEGRAIAVDSSSNVYICGFSAAGSPSGDIQIAKYDTSGAIQWQRSLGGVQSRGFCIAVDSSANLYVGGASIAGGNNALQVSKYNTSGVIQWQRTLSDAVNDEQTNGLAVDASGNVYLCGYSGPTGSTNIQIAKYNTSGTIQWQRTLGSSGNNRGNSVAIDASGNVYLCGYSSVAFGCQLAKYDTNGNIQWQRILGYASYAAEGFGIALDSIGNFYVCGIGWDTGPVRDGFLFAKLPGDGSRTGTFSLSGLSVTYANTSLTDSASSLTSAASSLTDAASSLTDSASSLTDSASSLTSTVTQL
jgi:hypothetical protein